MTTPWDDLLVHTVNIWQFKGPQDVDAGVDPDYSTSLATAAPAYVEPEQSSRVFDATNRVTLFDDVTVFLQQDFGLSLNDRIDWTDSLNVAHRFFVIGINDMTPQGGLCEVNATERT